MIRTFCLRILVAMFIFVFAPEGLRADHAPGEYDIKLAFLYNFTKFINWPEQTFNDKRAPFSICIMGKLPPHQTIKHITKRKAKNRPISIHFLHYKQSTNQCHVLFLTRSLKKSQIKRVVSNLSAGTLLVGEVAGFAKSNGVVEFILDTENRVKIEINLARAQQHDMEISAQLLEVAKKVYRKKEEQS